MGRGLDQILYGDGIAPARPGEETRRITGVQAGGKLLSDGRFRTALGQVITNVHAECFECQKHGCVIHNPTDHSMSHLPLNWRDDRGIMERICEHGVGHPDPDNLAYLERNYGEKRARSVSVHGCCAQGCCA